MRSWLSYLITASAAVIELNRAASAQLPVSPPTELPAVVVTAPRKATAKNPQKATKGEKGDVVISPTANPTPVAETTSSVTLITAADMERDQRRTAPDALITVPGINLVQSGGPGGVTSVFMRGTNSDHVKVLIDGIDVSDPSSPGRAFDFGQLLTADLGSIEVLRGPQSGLYGADALGGVIAITTKQGEGPPLVTGTVEAGSFGTFNQTSSLSGSEKGFNYAFNFAHLHSDATPVTPLELLPPGEKRNDDDYDNQTYSTKLGFDVTKDLTFNVVARYTDATLKFTNDDPFAFPTFPEARRSIQTVHQLYTRGESVLSLFGGAFKSYAAVGYTNARNSTLFPDSPLASENDGERIKYDWRGVTTLAPGQTLIVGLESQTERLSANANFLGRAATSAEETNRAGYVELQSEIAKRLFMAANVRLDDNDNFGDHATWRVAPAYIVPGTETKLKGSIGTAFHAPSLNDRFVDFPPFFFANPNLKPEASTGYDLGFEQPLLSNRLRVGVSYFRNDITDLIQTSFDPVTSVSTSINIGRAATYGTEWFASLLLTDELRLRGDYTHTDALDAVTGLELLRRPKDKASATLAWSPTGPWSFSATVLGVSSWDDIDRATFAPVTAPGFTIVNVAANYKIDDHMSLFGRVDNLFDLHYQDPTGFERPGLGVFVGIRLTNR
ncbi:MAG: TonB-dependent receptor [Hyphomicrobiaceae bacterium]|nr:TonB-dependent receptor [Hyphomicrobiaceae bacterium]